MPEQDPLHTQEQGVTVDREYILTHRVLFSTFSETTEKLGTGN